MNVSLLSLWLPIVLGTFLAWIASALIHMLLKYHNNDYRELENEVTVTDALRAGNPSRGLHAFPFAVDMKQMADPDVQARYEKGPVGFVIIGENGTPAMGRLMFQQIAYFLVGCVFVGYCASLALDPGASYFEVFRMVMTAAFLAFGWGVLPFSIWFGFPWAMSVRYLLDALIYAAVIAGSFAGFWPGAA